MFNALHSSRLHTDAPEVRLHRYRIAFVMLVENALAELAERLRVGELLVRVWLHEERERLPRDRLGALAATYTYTVWRRAQLAGGRELQGLARLERKTVGGDRHLRQVPAARADIQA